MARKSKAVPHLRIRLEPGLLARLEQARKLTGRTMTGEIVDRLKRSFQAEDAAKQDEDVATRAAKAAVAETRQVILDHLARAQRCACLKIAPKIPAVS